jgi:hypothetical protein
MRQHLALTASAQTGEPVPSSNVRGKRRGSIPRVHREFTTWHAPQVTPPPLKSLDPKYFIHVQVRSASAGYQRARVARSSCVKGAG